MAKLKSVSGNAVEQELLDLLGSGSKFKAQGKKESGEKYRGRLAKAVNDALDENEDLWDELSEAAQEWFNETIEALKGKKDAPEFPSDEDENSDEEEDSTSDEAEDEEEDEDEDDEEEEEEEPAPKASKKKASKKASKKAVKKSKAKDEDEDDDDDDDEEPAPKASKKGPVKRSGHSNVIRLLIVRAIAEGGEVSTKEIADEAEKETGVPINPSTVNTLKSDTLRIIEVLQSEGLLKKKLLK